jgi:hypothetical protein
MSEPNTDLASKEKSSTAIIVAVIAALAAITVAYLQYVREPGEKEKQFTGRVIDAKTEKSVRNAKITLEFQGAPPVIYTDSEGIFTFPLKEETRNIHIRVDADGYEKFDRRIDISAKDGIEDIRLNPARPIITPEKRTPNTEDEKSREPIKLKVKGDIPRSVYYTPNGSIIGKAEPGAALRVVRTVRTNNLLWYQVELENGDMYTNSRPIETLMSGWIPDLAVTVVEYKK